MGAINQGNQPKPRRQVCYKTVSGFLTRHQRGENGGTAPGVRYQRPTGVPGGGYKGGFRNKGGQPVGKVGRNSGTENSQQTFEKESQAKMVGPWLRSSSTATENKKVKGTKRSVTDAEGKKKQKRKKGTPGPKVNILQRKEGGRKVIINSFCW